MDDVFDCRLQWVVPVEIDGPTPFKLLAIWQANHRTTEFHPVWPLGRQVLASTVIYREWLTGPVVAAGDFNHDVRWDRPRSGRNHRDAIEALEALGCVSAYHQHRGCAQGKEPDPTFYLYRNVNEPSHIDYVFVLRTWRILDVTVGGYDEWKQLSDHHPVAVDVQPG